jgi:hypothetical protein
MENVHDGNVSMWLPNLKVAAFGDHHKHGIGVVPLVNHGPTAVEDHSSLVEMEFQHTDNLVPDSYHEELQKHHSAFTQKESRTRDEKAGHEKKFEFRVVQDNLPKALQKNNSLFSMLEHDPLGVVTTRNIANSQFMGWITVGTPPVPIQVVFDTGSTNVWLTSAHCDSGACPQLKDKYNAAKSSSSNPTNYEPEPEPTGGSPEDHASFIEMGNTVKDDGRPLDTHHEMDHSLTEMSVETSTFKNQAQMDLFHTDMTNETGRRFSELAMSGSGEYPKLFKSYYLHIRFGTGEIMGWSQKDTIRFGPVEVKNQVFGMVYEEKGSIFKALGTFGGILGCGFPSMSAQGQLPVFDNAMQQKIPPLFCFFMDKHSDRPSAFQIGGILKDTVGSNMHLVEVYQPHYWSMKLLEVKIGDESLELGDIHSLVVDSGTSSLTAPRSILQRILDKLGKHPCKEINNMPLFQFVVAVNGAREDEQPIQWAIPFTPRQYMLHSSGNPGICSPAWWNIDVPPPYGPAFLLGELFLKHYVTLFYREHGPGGSFIQDGTAPASPAVMAIAKAANPDKDFYERLYNGAQDTDKQSWEKKSWLQVMNDTDSIDSSNIQIDSSGDVSAAEIAAAAPEETASLVPKESKPLKLSAAEVAPQGTQEVKAPAKDDELELARRVPK